MIRLERNDFEQLVGDTAASIEWVTYRGTPRARSGFSSAMPVPYLAFITLFWLAHYPTLSFMSVIFHLHEWKNYHKNIEENLKWDGICSEAGCSMAQWWRIRKDERQLCLLSKLELSRYGLCGRWDRDSSFKASWGCGRSKSSCGVGRNISTLSMCCALLQHWMAPYYIVQAIK